MSEPSTAPNASAQAEAATDAAKTGMSDADDGEFHPIEEPVKREPPSPVMKGAKWGAVVGLVIAQLYMRQHSPLGFYAGNTTLVFLVCIGLASGMGAFGMWLNIRTAPDGDRPGPL